MRAFAREHLARPGALGAACGGDENLDLAGPWRRRLRWNENIANRSATAGKQGDGRQKGKGSLRQKLTHRNATSPLVSRSPIGSCPKGRLRSIFS